jgi:CO/xanthine dehydrogenase FAD-binding subunit
VARWRTQRFRRRQRGLVEIAGGRCKSASLAFNGVTAVPYHAAAVGAALVGSELSDEAIDQAVTEKLEIDEPLGDVQASGEYRVQLAGVYGRRALKVARDRARG